MKRTKIWAAVAAGVTAVAGVGLGSVWIPAAADQPAATERAAVAGVIVGY